MRRPSWYQRPQVMIAVSVVAVLVAVGAVVAAGAGGEVQVGPPGLSIAGALPTDTPDADVTSEAVASSPSPSATPSTTSTPSPTPTSTPTPTPTSTPTPTPEPTPPPPAIEVRPGEVGIGESAVVVVRAEDAAGATLRFQDVTYPMFTSDAGFWAVVGVPLNAAAGEATLSVELRDVSGAVLREESSVYQVVPVDRPIDQLTVTVEEASVLTPEASVRERQLRAQQFSQFDLVPRWNGLFIWPVRGLETTQFGQGRSINGGPVGGFHSGHDIANEEGTPIRASAPGRVAWVGEMAIRGNTVIVDHGGGVKTGYHHLLEIHVSVDEVVEAGTVVGLMGSTGFSTGPHLHWELTIYGVNVDPVTWTTTLFTP